MVEMVMLQEFCVRCNQPFYFVYCDHKENAGKHYHTWFCICRNCGYRKNLDEWEDHTPFKEVTPPVDNQRPPQRNEA